MTIRFNRVEGEAMFFYSTDEYNRYPCMDKYAKILILDASSKEVTIKGKFKGEYDD